MLEEVEDDTETWADTTEEDEISATGPASTAMDAIRRLALDLGEKTTIAVAQPLIAANIAKENWQAKQAGYILLGLISESCVEFFKKRLDEVTKTACGGVEDANVRVKFASLSAMTEIFASLAPQVQQKFHADVLPKVVKIMQEEQTVKMQVQAATTLQSFISGFILDEDEEDENGKDPKELMELYAKDLLQVMEGVLVKGRQTNNE
jgi:hypothetical protein